MDDASEAPGPPLPDAGGKSKRKGHGSKGNVFSPLECYMLGVCLMSLCLPHLMACSPLYTRSHIASYHFNCQAYPIVNLNEHKLA